MWYVTLYEQNDEMPLSFEDIKEEKHKVDITNMIQMIKTDHVAMSSSVITMEEGDYLFLSGLSRHEENQGYSGSNVQRSHLLD